MDTDLHEPAGGGVSAKGVFTPDPGEQEPRWLTASSPATG